MGIPTVGTSAVTMVNYAIDYDFKYANGMPIRYVAVPFPVTGPTRAMHREYIYGQDKLTGKTPITSTNAPLPTTLTTKKKRTERSD